VRQLVDDRHLRRPGDYGVHVHLLERHSAVRDLPARNYFHVPYLRGRLGATVGLDESHHDIDPPPAKIMRFLKHPDSLSHSRRRTDVDLELPPVAALEELDEFRRFRARRYPPVYRRSCIPVSLIEVVGHALWSLSEGECQGSYKKRIGSGCPRWRRPIGENRIACPRPA
jgi:hypothetical protein